MPEFWAISISAFFDLLTAILLECEMDKDTLDNCVTGSLAFEGLLECILGNYYRKNKEDEDMFMWVMIVLGLDKFFDNVKPLLVKLVKSINGSCCKNKRKQCADLVKYEYLVSQAGIVFYCIYIMVYISTDPTFEKVNVNEINMA